MINMQFLFDFLPIVLFFIAYKFGDIYIATTVIILSSLLHVIYSRYKTGTFQKMPLFTLLTISVLGGATLLFKNEIFIKWKPTALYWLLALILAISHLSHHFRGSQLLLQRLLEKQLSLNTMIWRRLNISWVLFFLGLGALNLYVVYHFDTATWVSFKLFGTLGITLLFVLLQGLYMSQHLKDPQR